MATSIMSGVQPAAPTDEVDPDAAAAKVKAAAAKVKAAAAKGADPAGTPPPPPPAEDTPDSASLDTQADALRSEIRSLEARQDGSPAVMTRASVEEREAAKLSSDEVAHNLSEKRKKLTGIVNQIIERQKVGSDPGEVDFAELPAEVSPGEQYKSSGQVYPGRSRERADEKVRQAETGVHTSESMRPGVYEYFRSGPEMGETEVEVLGDVNPETGERHVTKRRYAVSRKREELKRALGLGGISPTQPYRSQFAEGPMHHPYQMARAAGSVIEPAIDLVTSLPHGVVGGYIKDALTGKEDPEGMISRRGTHLFMDDRYNREDWWPKPEYLPEKALRGGIMSAPRGEVNEAKLALEMAERKRGIGGAKKEILRLKKEIPNLKDPAKHYASIAVLEDDIEQLRAEQTQLMRVKNVTIPRQIAEEEAAEKAEKLKDRFATKF